MGYRDVKSRNAVIEAMRECDRLERKNFQDLYGFAESDVYYLRHEGREYDSKPILAVAHKYQYPTLGALPNDFSGGKHHAAKHLARLGFTIDQISLPERDWSLSEVRLVVADYFDMFERLRAGETVNKADRIRQLAKRMPRRNHSAISRKQSNVSAILQRMELPWVDGIAPLPNAQLLLEAVIYDWLADRAEHFTAAPASPLPSPDDADTEVPPPSSAELRKTAEARRAVRVDFAAVEAANRKLGEAGERWAVDHLKGELRRAGRDDLAKRVRWVAQVDGDGLGYDIASFDNNGEPEFVEVKTTKGGRSAPFLVTPNELGLSETESRYVLLRIFGFGKRLRFYRLRGSLRKNCNLEPQLYRALPKPRRPKQS